MSTDDVEHTLFVCRQVNLYRVPPKATAGGHKSGEWKVADKIFTGRLKVTAKGDAAEVRLEDPDRCVSELLTYRVIGYHTTCHTTAPTFYLPAVVNCLPCARSRWDNGISQ